MDREDVEPEIEILAEPAGGHELAERPVRRGEVPGCPSAVAGSRRPA